MEVLILIAKVALTFLVLTGFYRLVLQNTRHYRIHRIYLILVPLIAAVLPTAAGQFISEALPAAIQIPVFDVRNPEPGSIEAERTAFWTSSGLYFGMFGLYISGVVFHMFVAVRGMLKTLQLVRSGTRISLRGFSVILQPRAADIFTFFGAIVVPDINVSKCVLLHEQTHVKQKHHLDLLYAELIAGLLWCVPGSRLYKNSVILNHELMADRAVLREVSPRVYGSEILAATFDVPRRVLAHSFYDKSLIKIRITMLYKNRLSPLRAAMSYLLILPLAAVLLTFSSMRLSAQTTDEDKNEDEVFQVVEEMPQYPGGNDALIKHLSDNLKYPKEAEEDRIEGIVYVSFIVDTDGSISDVKIVRGIGDSCDEEAQRVVASMPDWKPGKQRGKPVRVQFNLPIRFTLDDDKIENTDE